MKLKISKMEAKKKIDTFFKKESFNREELKKIKRIAMKFRIKLSNYKGIFCKICLNKLEGKTRIKKNHRIIECKNCGFKNKIYFKN